MDQFNLEYGQVQVLDNAVPVDMYNELLHAAFSQIGWKFGWNTPSNPHNRYWHHEVGYGTKKNINDISDNVKKHRLPIFDCYQDWLKSHILPENTRILRYYLNAHTFGTDGWPHTDTDRTDELTAVLYLTETWKPQWCGETVVFDQQGDIAKAALPKANRLLIFPSNYLHSPRPLAKVFQGMRVVLVTKFGSPTGLSSGFVRSNTEAENIHIDYLESLGAHEIDHSGRTLSHHLLGVYRLLKREGAPEHVCLAGLYHSIYGSSQFIEKTTSDRSTIRQHIGAEAEKLVWLFSILDRPSCWASDAMTFADTKGGMVELSAEDKEALMMIERANLREQGICTGSRVQHL